MARSKINTILPLDRYAQIMRIPLTHFNQFGGPAAPQKEGCDSIWDQEDRDALAWAMQTAEGLITDALRFYPAPVFAYNEQIKLGDLRLRSDWWNAEFQTRRKHVIGYGTRTLTLIQEAAPVEYIDDDNDPAGIKETAQIGSLLYDPFSPCADECSLRMFFRVGDGAKDPADPAYEIRGPIFYDRDPDADTPTYIVKLPSAMLLKPSLTKLTELACYGSDDPEAWIYSFDYDESASNFVEAVDIYCESINTGEQGIFYWSDVCTDCDGLIGDQMCARSVHDKNGSFKVWPTDGFVPYAYKPENMRISYKSGYPLDDYCRMDARLERAIVKLTNALLPEPPCGYCDIAEQMWTEDRKSIDPLTPEAAGLPWDIYSRGALDAWRIVKRLAY